MLREIPPGPCKVSPVLADRHGKTIKYAPYI
jgi:hypothetical protein